MKKILSLISSGLLVANLATTAGCMVNFNKNDDNYRQSTTDAISQISSVAARAGILSTEDGIDPMYTMNYYGNQKISTLIPQLFDKWGKDQKKFKANATLYQELKLLYGNDGDSWTFTDAGTNGQINFKGTKTPLDPAYTKQINDIKALLYLLQGGFSYNAISGFSELFSSPQFASILKTLQASASSLTPELLEGLGNSFNLSKFIPAASTNQQLIEGAKVLWANFLNNLRKTPGTYASEDQSKIVTQANLEAADKLIADSLKDIISGKMKSIGDALKSRYGLPEILHFIIVLCSYISQFNVGDGSSGPTLHLNDVDIKNSNFLFEKNVNNYDVLQKVLKTKYQVPSDFSLSNLFGILKLFFSNDEKNDSQGYNLEKLFVILFANKKSTDPVLNYKGTGSIPELTLSEDPTSNSYPLGFDQITVPTYLGAASYIKTLSSLIPTSLEEKIGSIPYKLLYDLSTNAPNLSSAANYLANVDLSYDLKNKTWNLKGGLVDDALIKLLKLVDRKLYNQILPYIEKIETFSAALKSYQTTLPQANQGVWEELYRGRLLKTVFEGINNIAGSNVISSNVISYMPNLKTIFNDKASTIINMVSSTPLPTYLYILKEKSISELFHSLASEFGNNGSETGKYKINYDLLDSLFSSAGQTADKSIAAAEKSGLSADNFKGPTADSKTTSTLAYALDLFVAKTPVGGVKSGFQLLGMNDAKGKDVLNQNSFFDNLYKLSTTPKTSPGLLYIFSAIGDALKAIDNGMQDNANFNFEPYLKNSNFVTAKSKEKIITVKGKASLIMFDTQYTDPIQINPKTHQHYKYDVRIWLTIINNPKGANYSWSKWSVESL